MSLVPRSFPPKEPIVSGSRAPGPKRLCAGLFAAFLLAAVPAVSAKAANLSNLGDSDDPKSLRSIAFKSYLDKNPDEALVFYQKAVNSAIKVYGPDSTFVADLYYEMGALSLESGKFVTAENWLQKAVAQNPNSIMARVKLAELLQVREKHTEALAQIQAALKKNPRSLEARHALVLWLIDRKNSAAAIKEAYSLEQLSKFGAAKSESAARIANASIPTPTIPPEPKAAAEPKPKAEKPAQLPVLSFLRGTQKKPAAAATPEPKPQPKPATAPQPKPASAPPPKTAKHVEAPKPAKTIETKHGKHKTKEKEHAPAHKAAPEPAEPVTALKAVPESLNTTLKTTAKQVKASAKPAPAAKPQPSENETPESAPVEQPAPVAVTPPPPVHIESHKGHPKPGLVPPPPPTIYFPPPQMMQAPRAKPVAAKPKPKEPPKEAKEPAAEAPEKPAATGGNSDDASFMLQWADVKRKSKSGSK